MAIGKRLPIGRVCGVLGRREAAFSARWRQQTAWGQPERLSANDS